MIFVTWFSLWLILAATPWGLIVPAIALIVRASFLERHVRLGWRPAREILSKVVDEPLIRRRGI